MDLDGKTAALGVVSQPLLSQMNCFFLLAVNIPNLFFFFSYLCVLHVLVCAACVFAPRSHMNTNTSVKGQ